VVDATWEVIMGYVVIAKWIARAGNEAAVAEALSELNRSSRTELGCQEYRVHRHVTQPQTFLLYEEYVDEASYGLHTQSEHFRRYALEQGIPLLESREREFYVPLGS
jgi:autoinducer 2-degrading protein